MPFSVGSPGGRDSQEPSQGRVLVVDDQRNMRTTLAMMLRGSGFHVDEAEDGTQGRRLGASGDYDVVLTDVKMGDDDGIDVLRAVKESHPATEVIHGPGPTPYGSAMACMP
jgi:DNA-binding NtrC family response regulator